MSTTQNITNGWEQTFTASSTTSIPVTNIPSSIINILIVYTNLKLSLTTNFPIIQFSTNGGSSYILSGYLSGITWSGYNAISFQNQNLTTGFQFGLGNIGTSNYQSGSISLYNINTANSPSMSGNGMIFDLTNSYYSFCSGVLPGTTTANSFQITTTSGNIATGTFKVYGLN